MRSLPEPNGHGGLRKVRSEDLPSADTLNHERLQFPSQRPDCPALCPPSARPYEIAILTACLLPYPSSSAHKQIQRLGSRTASRGVARTLLEPLLCLSLCKSN